jgi:hypothetical protein
VPNPICDEVLTVLLTRRESKAKIVMKKMFGLPISLTDHGFRILVIQRFLQE